MHPLIAPENMLKAEHQYFADSGIPSIQLMERAARALMHTVLTRYPGAQRICIACGPGGNGGDGYACARMLAQRGKRCYIFASAPAKSPDAVENARRAVELGLEIMDTDRLEGMPLPDLWIDCLYGTGLSRAPEGKAADLILKMNRDRTAGAGLIACDIPSGLNGRTGAAYAPCVSADITLAFQLAKYGHYLQDGLDMCGEIIVADVGFPDEIFPENPPLQLLPGDLRGMFAPRRRNIHKGKCGHLLIVAGSRGMAGAAALCANAALRSGAGLVSIACPEDIVPILQTLAPCAMCIPLPEENGAIAETAVPVLLASLKGKSAIAVGPGLSTRISPEVLRCLLDPPPEFALPAVIDADALNIIAQNPELKDLLSSRHVLTPHPGEAARLLGHSIEDPVSAACELASLGATAVLKGASRVICDEITCLISSSGCSGMARGGSGDILTGILGALLAEESGRSMAQSAAAACEIHGLAGKHAGEKYGSRAMNAADMLQFLPEVFRQYVE